VILAPPLLDGAVKLTVALALPGVALTPVGEPGTATGNVGVTLLDGAEFALEPAELIATTVKLYAAPLVSPVTVIGDPEPVA
jgi:hypothetical protein